MSDLTVEQAIRRHIAALPDAEGVAEYLRSVGRSLCHAGELLQDAEFVELYQRDPVAAQKRILDKIGGMA